MRSVEGKKVTCLRLINPRSISSAHLKKKVMALFMSFCSVCNFLLVLFLLSSPNKRR